MLAGNGMFRCWIEWISNAAQWDRRRRWDAAKAQAKWIVAYIVDRPAASNIQNILLVERRSTGVDVWECTSLCTQNSKVDFILTQTSSDEIMQTIYDDIQLTVLIEAHTCASGMWSD